MDGAIPPAWRPAPERRFVETIDAQWGVEALHQLERADRARAAALADSRLPASSEGGNKARGG